MCDNHILKSWIVLQINIKQFSFSILSCHNICLIYVTCKIHENEFVFNIPVFSHCAFLLYFSGHSQCHYRIDSKRACSNFDDNCQFFKYSECYFAILQQICWKLSKNTENLNTKQKFFISKHNYIGNVILCLYLHTYKLIKKEDLSQE